MSQAINRMIDSVCRCIKCDAPYGQCRCWVNCECTGCGAKWSDERVRPMSENIARITMPKCPGCDPNWQATPDCEIFDYEGRRK